MYDVVVHILNGQSEEAESLKHLFKETEFAVQVTTRMEDLLRVCRESLFDLGIIWDGQYNEIADLLTVISIHRLDHIPFLVVTRRKEDLPVLLTLPVAEFVVLPVSQEEFFTKIRRTIQDVNIQATVLEGLNWQGSLQEYNLVDLIQMVETSQRDATLTMHYADKQGEVLFQGGKVVQARFRNLQGMAAILKLGFWSQGHFQIRFSRLTNPEDQIQLSNQEILIQLIQKLSEQAEHMKGLPGYFEELLANPLQEAGSLSSIQKKILDIAAEPITIFDILTSLTEDDRDILRELRELFEQGLIGYRGEVEKVVLEEQQRSSFSKIFSSLSSIFRKKPEYTYEEMMATEQEAEMVPAKIEIARQSMAERDRERLAEILKGAA